MFVILFEIIKWATIVQIVEKSNALTLFHEEIDPDLTAYRRGRTVGRETGRKGVGERRERRSKEKMRKQKNRFFSSKNDLK